MGRSLHKYQSQSQIAAREELRVAVAAAAEALMTNAVGSANNMDVAAPVPAPVRNPIAAVAAQVAPTFADVAGSAVAVSSLPVLAPVGGRPSATHVDLRHSVLWEHSSERRVNLWCLCQRRTLWNRSIQKNGIEPSSH
jgi:hypothetical protein